MKYLGFPRWLIATLAALLVGYGCAVPPAMGSPLAQATILSTDEAAMRLGTVGLEETADGLAVTADFADTPAGTHGFHIHTAGSCAEGGSAAGGHYNPNGTPHGLLIEDGFEAAHAGDLGNLKIDEDGTGTYSSIIPGLTLTDGDYPVADRAFILHAKPDDFGQPTGHAGSRVGCGVISLVES